ALVKAGTGGGPAAELIANAQVLPPTASGYTPTGPLPDPTLTDGLLTQAGYTKPAGMWISAAGAPLALTIAVPLDRPDYLDMGREVQRQLTAAGIQSRLTTPEGEELFAELLAPDPALPPGGTVTGIDIVIAPQPSGGDPATMLATRFGCAPATEGRSRTVAANPLGFCDPVVQQAIDATLSGAMPLSAALEAIEPVLWSQAVTVPLYQEADVLVVRLEMSGVTAGAPFAGPFADAARWRRGPK
ncbi:MAG: ABC transporter family substrate-binding protein, partial [Actinomycetota bacterium]|nr:ABC transporter family substrate-binding protein [Actinomycetota bacterium]